MHGGIFVKYKYLRDKPSKINGYSSPLRRFVYMEDAGKSINLTTDLFVSEEKFRRLSDLMPVAIITTDTAGRLSYYNKYAEKLFGSKLSLNDAVETAILGSARLLTPEGIALSNAEAPVSMVLITRKPVRDLEFLLERNDGSRSNVLINIDVLLTATGEFNGAIYLFQDVSESKKTQEDALRLAAIVTSSEDAIISKTLDGTIRTWNKGAEKIFGYTEDEIVGKSIRTLIPADRQDDEDLIISKISKGELVNHFETIRIDKHGNQIPISITVSPIKNDQGQVVGASKIARNISSQVEIQQQLKLYNERLEQLNNYKDEFIGMASHELKTPLTSIKANLQILERKLIGNENQEFVTKTLKHISRLNGLISDLLDVSKIQAGKLQLNFSTFNLKELLTDAIETVQHTTTTHRVKLELSDDQQTMNGDRERIEQVILNLLTNAIKYSPNANQVIVRAERINDKLLISIQDFGIGIAKDNLEKVFNRFYRVEGLDPHFSGLGIGLYIAYEIVKRHKGEMWVESVQHEGSTFYFRI